MGLRRVFTPGAFLSFLGRNAAVLMALTAAFGLLVPGVQAIMKPALLPAMVIATLGAFLGATFALEKLALRPYVLAVIAWVVVGPVFSLGLIVKYLGIEPGLSTGIMLAFSAPVATSVPAFAALLKLSPKLALVTFLAAVTISPITMPAILAAFALQVDMDLVTYTSRVFLITAGGWAGAWIIRRNLSKLKWLIPDQPAAAGVSVIGLFILFSSATGLVRERWDELGAAFLPVLELAIGLNVVYVLAGSLLFILLGTRDAFTVGLMSGNRHVGLTWAAAVGSVPAAGEAYLAASLLLISLMPLTFQQVSRLVGYFRKSGPRPTVDLVWFHLDRPSDIRSLTLEVGGKYVIGRSLDADVQLEDRAISRSHAEVSATPEGLVFRDLESTNGLIYRGERQKVVQLPPDERVEIVRWVFGLAHAADGAVVVEWWQDENRLDLDSAVLAAGRSYTIGRSSDADVRLPDRGVSRLHARIEIPSEGEPVLTDTGSTNGTWLGEERITSIAAQPETQIRIGPFFLKAHRVGAQKSDATQLLSS